jgi:hypothetical protein
MSVISARSEILTRTNVITTLTTVISTHTRVISTHTRVIFTRRVWCWQIWVWLWHSYVLKPHSACTHAECIFYTQSVISSRSMRLKRTNLITTLNTVILTRTRVIYTRRVWFWVWLRHARVRFTHARVEFRPDSVTLNRTN